MTPKILVHALLILAFALSASPLQSAIVVLNFTGTYDTQGATLFGLTGSAVPFSYQITYDTSLDTDADFIAAGTNVGGNIATHDWHAYSKSGITSSTLNFGNQTWTVSDDFLPRIANGLSAEMWFDTDISLAAPTRVLMDIDTNGGNGNYLGFGELAAAGGNFSITPGSFVGDQSNEALSTSFSIQSNVPEPGKCLLLFVGVVTVAARRRRVIARI